MTRRIIRLAAPPMPHRPAAVPDADRWRSAGVEPTVEDLLNDPLTALVMRRDGLRRADVEAAVDQARRQMRPALAFRPGRAAPPPRALSLGPGLGADLLRLP